MGTRDSEPEKQDAEEPKKDEVVTPVVWDDEGTAWPGPTGPVGG